ncbi:hypothetical protein BDF14DRAFT_789965 [Spinellus fusiger]|nr:hypothetical protein BDF14DRAFT_789965 [Spinellus fusiger]
MSQPFVYSDQRPASDTSSHPPYENTLYRRDSRQEQVFQIPYSALIEQLEKSGQLGELGQLGLVDESEEWGEKPLEQSRRPLPLLPPLSPLSPLSSQGARKEDSGQEGEVSYKGQPLYQPHQPYHPQSQHQSQQPYNAFILQGEEHQPRRSASRYSTTQPWSPNPSTSPTRVARYSTIERPGRVESMKIEVPQPLPTHPQDAPLKLQKPFDPSTSSSTLDIDALALSLGVDMSKPRNSMEFLLSHHNKRRKSLCLILPVIGLSVVYV